MKYNPQKIEGKWQRYWKGKKIHETKDTGKKNFMLLAEFPYTSGNLHIGHWFTYSVADIFARYLRMNGYNVLYPIGFDAFGLPAENAAIKNKTSPALWTKKNIKRMTKQIISIGAAFDWSRLIDTSDPDYYKWTQWIFLKLYEKGLAYRDKTQVNWCPKDKTVLANEQVVNGCCERCDTPVEQRELIQWMFRITSFADVLVDDLNPPAGGLDWPETTKLAQQNWIGRSEGARIKFNLDMPGQPEGKHFAEIFTTRPDTIFGATFLVVSPELVKKWMDTSWAAPKEVEGYVENSLKKTDLQRQEEAGEKTGINTQIKAIHPLTGEKIPVWVADYVLSGYGTGAIMAVPAHDERDYQFAKKFNLEVKKVIIGRDNKEIFTDYGVLIDSGEFTGLSSQEAIKKIIQKLGENNMGRPEKNFRLHDWILSRQRYWGAPIPMIYCKECARLPAGRTGGPDGQGYVPVPEKDLPVKLPKLNDFKPAEDGKSPLARAAGWLKVKCPSCGGEAERETDTMDTFVDSSWYFIRYTDSDNKEEFAEKEKMKKWLPVPMYVGGQEHNTMHLLYARFVTKALNSLNIVEFSEPFLSRRNHGVIMGPDGKRMSKSRGNVVDPDSEVKKYGADVIRINFAFLGPFDQDYSWNPNSLNGISRFLNRVWNFADKGNYIGAEENKETLRALNKAIKNITDDVKDFKFNTAVSELMILMNTIEKYGADIGTFKTFIKILSPFAPHLAEEIWIDVLKNKTSIHLEAWPEYDEKLLAQEKINLVVQINGKIKDLIEVKPGLSEEEIKEIVMTSDKIKKQIEGKTIKKFIYIRNKLTNLVI